MSALASLLSALGPIGASMAQTAQPQPKKKPRSSLKRSRNEKQKPFDPIEFKKVAAQADQGTLNELRKFTPGETSGPGERRSRVTRTSGGGVVDPFAPQGTAWVDAFGPKRDSVRQRQEELDNNGRMTPDVFNMAKQAVASRKAEMQNAIPFTQYQQPPKQLPYWQRPSGMVQDNPNGGRQLDSLFGQGSFNPGAPPQQQPYAPSNEALFGGPTPDPWAGQIPTPPQVQPMLPPQPRESPLDWTNPFLDEWAKQPPQQTNVAPLSPPPTSTYSPPEPPEWQQLDRESTAQLYKAMNYTPGIIDTTLAALNPMEHIRGGTSQVSGILPGANDQYPNPDARLKGDSSFLDQMYNAGKLKYDIVRTPGGVSQRRLKYKIPYSNTGRTQGLDQRM